MTTCTALLTYVPGIAGALALLLAVAAIGLAIWIALPRAADRYRKSDIEHQIKTLRQGADHAVQTRPRVRAHSSTRAPSMPPRSCGNADSPSPPLKPCGGGLCRHRADCADTHCPGRLAASLTGVEARFNKPLEGKS